MQQGQLPFPDFTLPDSTLSPLPEVDLARPDFLLPDPARSELSQLPLWPDNMDQVAPLEPDPALPDLLEPEQPDTLIYPAGDAHALVKPENAPEVVMQQRPGELDPAAASMVLHSPDEETLPTDLSYAQLYTNDEQMTWRKRHFALLEPGLTDHMGESNAD